MDELIKSSDILFADETVVLHVSGNKETEGKIVKSNQGLAKIFGYSKTEVVGHNINILMPSLFAKRHTEFLEKFFKTGYKSVFNTERNFFGIHRNGFCFHMRILIKQMPSLEEGIQYVGMICQTQSDCEYILTDMRGVIDGISTGISSLLNLPVTAFKETDINIQILAPELINIFSANEKNKILMEKYKETGGQKLTFFVPKDFINQTQSDNKKNAKDIGKGNQSKVISGVLQKKGKSPIYRDLNKDLNKHNGIATKSYTVQQIIQSEDYKECETKQIVKCEIQDPVFGEEHKDIEPLKIRVLKINGINLKLSGSISDANSDADDIYRHSGESQSVSSLNRKQLQTFKGKEEDKEEIKKSLAVLMNMQPESKPEEKKNFEVREDTKTTEKLPGNIVTTESRIETLELKQKLIVKQPLESKKTIEENAQIKIKEEIKITKNMSLATSHCAHGSEEFLAHKLEQRTGSLRLIKLEEIKKEESAESSTPRMQIGSLKGPDFVQGSIVAENNTVNPIADDVYESSSAKSAGKAKNIKDTVQEESKKNMRSFQ